MSAQRNAQVRSEFLDWMLLTDGQRATLRLPRTQAEFAKAKGVGERTLRRWLNADPQFQAELESRRTAVLTETTPGAASGALSAPLLPAVVPSGVTEVEATFNAAWAKLQDLIASGDKNALQMYLTSPLAKAMMEAQLEAQRSDFADLTDTDLADAILDTVTDDELLDAARRRGLTLAQAGGHGQ
jgi:hypothetical protein